MQTKMNKSYTEHFDQRGSAYERAMRRYPQARDEEFQQLISAAKLTAGMQIADVPAGGGYLKRYLPDNTTWLGHEPCASFTNHTTSNNASVPLLPLPWPESSIDCVMSLAGVHHLKDKSSLFQEIKRVLKPNAQLVLSDVAENTQVARFLDQFVGAHNSTGHEGIYLNDNTEKEIASLGFQITKVAQVNLNWRLPSKRAAADFCTQLFDLKDVTSEEVIEALEDYLGFRIIQNNWIGVNWQLTTITAHKNDH